MQKKKTITTITQPDLYYQILKECVDDPKTSRTQISIKLGISEIDSSFRNLQDLQFIKINNGNLIELLPQGFSTYLSLSSQKQSAELSRRSIQIASWAIEISIVSFIASILFNILSFFK